MYKLTQEAKVSNFQTFVANLLVLLYYYLTVIPRVRFRVWGDTQQERSAEFPYFLLFPLLNFRIPASLLHVM